jgi:type IV secretory pathway VirJ component
MNEKIRENLIKTIQNLDDETILAISDYIEFIRDAQEEAPTDQDFQAILTGRHEYAQGEYVTWRKTSTNDL